MEDATENSVVNPDQDLNEDGVGSSDSLTTALAQTETQGARVTCENNKVETDSQEKDCEQRNEITASLSGESKLLPIQHSGEESNEKDHLHDRDGQDETKNEDENNDSGTEEPRKQTCLEALEIEGTITEASGTNENLNSNVSEENDLSCNVASDGGYTNQTESPSITSQRLEDSVVDEDTGNEDKTSSDELTSQSEQRALESTYQIKWIKWKGIDTPIITQNENGPCPLLAVVNVLLLQRRVNIPSPQEIVTSGQLMEYIGDCILEESPKVCHLAIIIIQISNKILPAAVSIWFMSHTVVNVVAIFLYFGSSSSSFLFPFLVLCFLFCFVFVRKKTLS